MPNRRGTRRNPLVSDLRAILNDFYLFFAASLLTLLLIGVPFFFVAKFAVGLPLALALLITLIGWGLNRRGRPLLSAYLVGGSIWLICFAVVFIGAATALAPFVFAMTIWTALIARLRLALLLGAIYLALWLGYVLLRKFALLQPLVPAENLIGHWVIAVVSFALITMPLLSLLTRARDALLQAEHASRAKTRFLSNMSHEIRTPMSAVLGLTELALQEQDGALKHSYIEKAHRAAQSMLGVLNDILDMSKIEAGKLEFTPVVFDLHELLGHLRESMGFAASQKHLKLQLQIDAGVPQRIIGDPLRLNQVLLNLLGNAVKFTHQGHIDLRVERLPDPGNACRLQFTVRDTGIGISAAQLTQLFQPFAQADNSITRDYGGTGLGLAICKQLVTLMEGEISADSEPGAGSSFRFHARFALPPADAALAAARAGHEPASGTLTPPITAPDASLAGMHVLLVEDNEVNRHIAIAQLGKQGVRVSIAVNGQQALDTLGADGGDVDLVLMDVQMPVLDGLSATREIRKRPALRQLPVIAMTAHAMHEEVQRCRDAGMQDFIAKPFRPVDLINTLQRWRPR